jgi:hypothetical protein
MPGAQEGVDVIYLPYIPLAERVVVGDWELIPGSDLRTADCQDERVEELARGLGQVYVLPKDHRTPAGAFARGARAGLETRLEMSAVSLTCGVRAWSPCWIRIHPR